MFLFIHPLGGTRSLWLPQIRGILGLDNTYTDKQILDLFTLSLPGHPDDDEELNFTKTRKLIDDFISTKFDKQETLSRKMLLTNKPEVIQVMKSSKLFIIGHELGGAVALNYTLANLNKIQRLVLVGCGNRFNQTSLRIRSHYYRYLQSLNLNQIKKKYLRAKNLRKKNFLYIFTENTTGKALQSGLKMLQDFNFEKAFQKLDLDRQLLLTKLPILAIRGQFDFFCEPKSLNKLNEILNPNRQIWQQKRSVINLGKPNSNISIKTYPLSGANPMDKDQISFVLDVRQFLRG